MKQKAKIIEIAHIVFCGIEDKPNAIQTMSFYPTEIKEDHYKETQKPYAMATLWDSDDCDLSYGEVDDFLLGEYGKETQGGLDFFGTLCLYGYSLGAPLYRDGSIEKITQMALPDNWLAMAAHQTHINNYYHYLCAYYSKERVDDLCRRLVGEGYNALRQQHALQNQY